MLVPDLELVGLSCLQAATEASGSDKTAKAAQLLCMAAENKISLSE